MARVEAGAADGGYRLPGAYRKLLLQDCRSRTEVDPRIATDMSREDIAALKDQARFAADEIFEERLLAGEPLTMPRWRLGGHTVPVPRHLPMFRERSIKEWTVWPDDTVTPRRGE